MALKSSVLGHSTEGTAYQVLVEDELIERCTVREVPFIRCAALAADLLSSASSSDEAQGDDILRAIAQRIAVRDYLEELGENPDAPSLG